MILLINPPFDYGKFETASSRCPPLGLAYVAAYLEKFGHKVKILDAFVLALTYEQIQKEIEDTKPEIVGITGATTCYSMMMDIAKLVKKINPKTPVVVGGPHATIMPESCFANGCVDYVVVGEGEYTAKELFETIIAKKSVEDIAGIAYVKDGKFHATTRRPLVDNLDDLPDPAYHLLPMDAYKPYAMYDVGKKFCSMITSRGCPNFCIFCTSSALWQRRYRTHSPGRVLKLMKMLYDTYGIRHIYFQDDEFILAHDRAEKLCGLIIDSKMDMLWECLARADHVDYELLKKMKQAGCVGILYGVESGCPETLIKIKKRITIEQVINACKWTSELGMWSRATFIIGFPFEGEKEIRQTIDLAKSLDVDIVYFNILTPYPNTEVYDMVVKENLFVDNADWNRWISHGTEPVMRTKYLTNKEVAYWTGRAYMEFYMRPIYLARKFRSIKNFTQLKRNFFAGIELVKISLGWMN